jgi:hypothetical protein
MVSRGGRSKGCANCRRRRVKCGMLHTLVHFCRVLLTRQDENRPVCGQCVKRRLDCGGPKDLTWIDQSSAFEPAPTNPAQNAVVKIASPTQLSLAAFEDDICLAYTRKNLLRGGPVEIACNMIESYAASMKSDDPGLDLLRKGIVSLSVTFFGSQNQQGNITNKGYHKYGEVLRQLNCHLAQPELQVTNETLLTALSCMLLEIFLPTGPTNFLKHQRGLDAIARLRGPPKESDRVNATIFRGLRILSIVGSLVESRASLYSTEEWRQMPPVYANEAGLFQHHVFTILADCTRLISHRNTLLRSRASPMQFESLLTEVEAVLRNLEALLPFWEVLNRNQLAEVTERSNMAKILGVANHVSATAYMLYNTAYICIIQIKDSLSPSPVNMALRNAAAMEIAQCLELKEYEQREGAPQSNTIAFVAIKVAWQALGGFNSAEGQRLAHTVRSATNSVFPRPSTLSDESPFAHYVEESLFSKFIGRIPLVAPDGTAYTGGEYDLWPDGPPGVIEFSIQKFNKHS